MQSDPHPIRLLRSFDYIIINAQASTKRDILWKSTENLLSVFECLRDPDFINSHKTHPAAFSRQRRLPFHILVLFFLNQVKDALQREVDEFFEQALQNIHSVSNAAICSARQALKPEVFRDLNRRFLTLALPRTQGQRFHDRRVFAIDGSTLNLPRRPTFFSRFGGQVHKDRELPMAKISQLIDVGTGLTLDALIMPYALSEQTLATAHLHQLPDHSVTLYDRGYFGEFLCFCHRQHQRDFVIRMPRKNLAEADALFNDPKAPKQINLVANNDCRRPAAEMARQGSLVHVTDPLRLRLVRVVLKTGEIEVLLTSLLDEKRYPDADFAALYDSRWTIEIDFRSLKSRLQLENYTGRKPVCVEQDFHAKILTKNLVQFFIALEQEAMDRQRQLAISEQLPRTRHRTKINFVDALQVAKFTLVYAIAAGSIDAVEEICTKIIRYCHAERKGRSYPRNHTKARATRFPMAYKQTA